MRALRALYVALIMAVVAPMVSSCGAAGGGLGTLLGGYLLYRELHKSNNNTTGLTSEIAVTNVAGGALTMNTGDTFQLVVKRTYQIIVNGVTVPQIDDVTNSCSYSSGQADVASVTTGGLITGLQPGTANINILYINGPLQNTASIVVNVVTPTGA